MSHCMRSLAVHRWHDRLACTKSAIFKRMNKNIICVSHIGRNGTNYYKIFPSVFDIFQNKVNGYIPILSIVKWNPFYCNSIIKIKYRVFFCFQIVSIHVIVWSWNIIYAVDRKFNSNVFFFLNIQLKPFVSSQLQKYCSEKTKKNKKYFEKKLKINGFFL